jgi:DNA-binding beta-propeller fold protein YncE
VTVAPQDANVYVANQGDGTVSVFTIEVMGGLVVARGSPVAAGTGPSAVTTEPSNRYVFVANATSNTLSGYTTGTAPLAPLSGSPFTTGASPYSVAVDPLDNFVYVANKGSSNISAYALGAGGTLTEPAGSPFAAGGGPTSVAVDPTGRFAYVANAGSGDVSVFAISLSIQVMVRCRR